jgi:phosphatidylserine/phosphatidylglycerophosphate/cardiolipin synthase-like enzyme
MPKDTKKENLLKGKDTKPATVKECQPGYWFLHDTDNGEDDSTQEEERITSNQLLAGRVDGWKKQNETWGINEDALLLPWTTGNNVTVLVDGENFMTDLYNKISGLVASESLLIAGWEFWTMRWLVQQDQVGTSLGALLRGAIQKKVEVRLLAFKNPLPGLKARTENLVDLLNDADENCACRDGDLGGFAMSHHQKAVFVGKSTFTDSCAYVGGMDLAVDRWDTSQHAKSWYEKRFKGWHDIQVRVQGDAITQIWANFAERWEDVKARQQLKDCPIPDWAKADKAKVTDKGKKAKKKSAQRFGTQHVQVLRTVATAPNSNPHRFMREGERTVLCALRKAISNAECYIYIEEQFLWDCELADFIASALQKHPRLHVIVVIAAVSEAPAAFGGWQYHLRSRFFKTLMRVKTSKEIKFGSTYRVYAYAPYQTSKAKYIYVHSKLIIIDDRYVAIGSANVNARSMHIETELTLGIVDDASVKGVLGKDAQNQPVQATVCEFAKNLREQLWKEHLDKDDITTADPIDWLSSYFPSSDPWPASVGQAAAGQKGRLRCYINEPGSYRLVTPAMQRIIDRTDRRWRRFGGRQTSLED